ncbi:MAG: 30S ribosomal protein S3 [Gammaproteobacteria bacterium RIFCSPHIGHO2_02_FULL_42_13]|nr:MAG: 30S ribosomal protein S3 [Gammaproteobacteria bacterium RIFCSPHIGHO2_02_FULL_42_13]OGT68454.1 MAG: 30S ribosomal protein S3 [Gammaproteobacteria bacterium RIFCSPLOWO2_02_FULL_42_9]
MGQKVHPGIIRLGITKNWLSRWYVDSKEFANTVCADIRVRRFLEERFEKAAISRIEIERPARNARIIIHAARPGVIIGKSGKEIDTLHKELSKQLGVPVQVTIEEVRKADLDAKLVAEGIAAQLVKRVSFRRAMKRAVSSAMRAGAQGIKICASGRLGGAEIARTEWIRHGRIPLHTFRADIDYGLAEAQTTYGIIGVRVWICRGEQLGGDEHEQNKSAVKGER